MPPIATSGLAVSAARPAQELEPDDRVRVAPCSRSGRPARPRPRRPPGRRRPPRAARRRGSRRPIAHRARRARRRAAAGGRSSCPRWTPATGSSAARSTRSSIQSSRRPALAARAEQRLERAAQSSPSASRLARSWIVVDPRRRPSPPPRRAAARRRARRRRRWRRSARARRAGARRHARRFRRLALARCEEPLHEAGREPAGDGTPGRAGSRWCSGIEVLDALDDEEVERPPHAGDRLLAVAAVDDQLGDQRVVVRRDDVVLVAVRVDAHAGAAGQVEGRELARATARRCSGSSALMRHSMAWPRGLQAASGSPSGSPAATCDLQLHQVDAGDHLGHRVLDLDARVHLHEVEAAVAVEQELDRAGVLVADRRGRARTAASPISLAQLRRQRRRRRLLDQLLVPALDRALALAEVDDVAVLVAEDLELDVPRLARGTSRGRSRRRRRPSRPRSRAVANCASSSASERARCACRGRRRRPPP